MTTFTDTNFTYKVLSDANKTLSIIGLNTTTYSGTNPNWGTFPSIPPVYSGPNNTYNGGGNSANAYKITEIGVSAFELKTSFSNTTLTPTFLSSNLTTIGDKAFASVKLVGTLTIPENIVSIGTMAFYNCNLITGIVIGKVTNSDVISHLSDLTVILNQEILDRKNADDSLNLLKAPVNDATFAGTTTIPTATITNASISTANITNGKFENAVMQNPVIANRLDVSGNITFSGGSVTTTGQWDFVVQPKHNTNVIATEEFVNVKMTALAGDGLSSTMNTLADLATAIGNDPSLASTVMNGNSILLKSITSEISLRNSAIASISTLMSTSVSSLASRDVQQGNALSTEISTRLTEVSNLSSMISTAASSLNVVDDGVGTALSTETSVRTSAAASLSTVLSTATSSLTVVDSGMTTSLSTEISARTSAIASLSKNVSTTKSSLSVADSTINANISTEIAQASQSISAVSAAVSTAASSLTVGDSSLSTALSVELVTRTSTMSSLSTSTSVAMSLQNVANLAMSTAFGTESTALSTSVSSLSNSTSVLASGLASTNANLKTAISVETQTRSSQATSLSTIASTAVSSLSTSNVALSTALSIEVSARISQAASISTMMTTVMPSLSTVASGLSLALSTETVAASTAISVAMSNLKGNAPGSLDTIVEIANELNTNPSLTQIASVMADVTATSNALSTEIVNRTSAVASVSSALSSALVSLSTADATMSTALSTEVSTFNASILSVSASLSNATSVMTSKNAVLSTILVSEISVRAASVNAVGNGLTTASTSLVATDTALSAAISTEITARAGSVVSFSTSISAANSSLNSIHAVMSTGVSTETSTRTSLIASLSSGISASTATMQAAINATSASISTVSSEAALKATTANLTTQISTLMGGAPAAMDTLVEIGAALDNQNNFAGSITTELGNRAAAADVSLLSSALALKADQTNYSSLSTVVTTLAPLTSVENASVSINVLTNEIVSLSAAVSTLKVNGAAVNPGTVAVNSVSLSDLYNWTKELYTKLTLTNANGTVNEKINRMTSPVLVSSILGFEYDANDAVTKVNHIITVKFDKDLNSVALTGGVGNPTTTINNMALNASLHYVFTIPYNGNVAYYTANKTTVSIVALESQYKLPPLSPTLTVSAPNETSYKNATPVVGTPYASVIWDSTAQIVTQRISITAEQNAILQFDLGGYTSSNIAITAFSNASAVAGKTNQFSLSATSAQFDLKYARSLVGTGSNSITATSLGSATKLAGNALTITGIVNDVPQHAVPTIVSNSKLISTSGSTFTYTATFTNAESAAMEVFDANSNVLATAQPTVNSPYSYNYDSSSIGYTIFKIKVKDTSSKRASEFLTVDGEDIPRFATPTISSISYSGTDPYLANMTWNVDSNVTSVDLKRAQSVSIPRMSNTTNIKRNQLLGVTNGQKGTISIWWEIVDSNAGILFAARANSSYGDAVTMSRSGQNVYVYLKNRSTSVGSFQTTSNPISGNGNYHLFASWDLNLGKYHIYVNGVKQTLGGSVTIGQTISYSEEITTVSFGTKWFASSATETLNGYLGPAYVNYVEYVDPVTSIEKFIYNGLAVSLGSNGSLPTGNSPIVFLNGTGTNSGYGGDFGSGGAATAMSTYYFVALPAGAAITTNTISTVSGTKTANLVVSYQNSAAPFDVIVVANGNANGRESIMNVSSSTSKKLVKTFTAPVLNGSISYTGSHPTYNANFTLTLQSGVTEVTVLKSDLTPLPAGATIATNVVSGTTATLAITHTNSITPFSIVVIAQGNLTGHTSAPSATITIFPKFDIPILQGISYSGTGPYEATMTYTVNSQVTSLTPYIYTTQGVYPFYNLTALPTGASITHNTVSGTTATLTISYTEAVAPLRVVVFAAGNSVGRQSNMSNNDLLYSGTIRNVTFTQSATVAKNWYFNFVYDGTSLSSFSMGITWKSDGGSQGGSINMDCLSLVSTGSTYSLLIPDPNGYLDIAYYKGPMLVSKVANVSINYTTTGGLSKNITTSFVPNPITTTFIPTVFNMNSNSNPGTCSFTVPGALDVYRVGMSWFYELYFREVGTDIIYYLTNVTPYANGVDMTWNSIQIPITLFGRTFTAHLKASHTGHGYVGNYQTYETPIHSNTITVPLPSTIFPTELTDIYNMGMNWSSSLIINDVRLFRFTWFVSKYALNPSSPTYVANVRISVGSNDYAGTNMTNLVYNYADGVGYAMTHTGQFTALGRGTANWLYTIRPENSDGSVVGTLITKSIYGGPGYSVGYNTLASMAPTGYQLHLNQNLIETTNVSNLSNSEYTWNSGTDKYATNVSFKTAAMFMTSTSTRKHKITLLQSGATVANLGEFEFNNTSYTINVNQLSPSTTYIVRINLMETSNGNNVNDPYGNPYVQERTLTVPAAPV